MYTKLYDNIFIAAHFKYLLNIELLSHPHEHLGPYCKQML